MLWRNPAAASLYPPTGAIRVTQHGLAVALVALVALVACLGGEPSIGTSSHASLLSPKAVLQLTDHRARGMPRGVHAPALADRLTPSER